MVCKKRRNNPGHSFKGRKFFIFGSFTSRSKARTRQRQGKGRYVLSKRVKVRGRRRKQLRYIVLKER